jgi:hypothetical protein
MCGLLFVIHLAVNALSGSASAVRDRVMLL